MKLLHFIPAYREQITIHIARQMMLDYGDINARQIGYMPWWIDSSDLPSARNQAMAKAIDEGWDYLVMQDSDIYCPTLTHGPIAMMLDTMQATDSHLVGAICGLRRIQLDQVAPNVSPLRHGEVYEARRVGTGLVLIDVKATAELLAEYTGPWFGRTYKDPRQTKLDFGEDFFFCAILQRHNGKITIDGRVETIHAYTDHVHLRYAPGADGDGNHKPETT